MVFNFKIWWVDTSQCLKGHGLPLYQIWYFDSSTVKINGRNLFIMIFHIIMLVLVVSSSSLNLYHPPDFHLPSAGYRGLFILIMRKRVFSLLRSNYLFNLHSSIQKTKLNWKKYRKTHLRTKTLKRERWLGTMVKCLEFHFWLHLSCETKLSKPSTDVLLTWPTSQKWHQFNKETDNNKISLPIVNT